MSFLKKINIMFFTFGKEDLSLKQFFFDFPQNISLGKNVFINRNVIFEGKGKIKIGNNVQIGPNTIFLTTSHLLTFFGLFFLVFT